MKILVELSRNQRRSKHEKSNPHYYGEMHTSAFKEMFIVSTFNFIRYIIISLRCN